jgi:Cu(I)/Ag(I) efflux system membrane fusion protein
MKNILLGLWLIICLSMFSCQDSAKKNQDKIDEENSFLSDTTYLKLSSKIIVKDSLLITYKMIMDKYMDLSTALIESEPEEASKNAKEMLTLFQKAYLKSLTKEQINIWYEQEDAIALFLSNIINSKDLKIQRSAFYPLSEDVYDLFIQIGIRDYPVYKQFCPMAFKDKGAFWLSKSEDILNPYFGSAMLHCGEIKEKIVNN